jgi:hypothetical protein
MSWIPSYGSKIHLLKGEIFGNMTSVCGIVLDRDPVDNPPENAKCKRCLKLYEAIK